MANRPPEFAPADLTDGRKPGQWQSRYTDEAAQQGIRGEARYLAALLFLAPTIMVILWLEIPLNLLAIPEAKYHAILTYGLAWASGTLGGTLFAIKWLYHMVAVFSWNLDRRLWRLFTPHISGGFAFAVVALVASGTVRVFDRGATDSPSLVVGLSFLVGYFSDNTIAKLAEVAETIFGATRSKSQKVETSKLSAPEDEQHQ